MADWKEKILHYRKRLEKASSDEKVLETLHKLQKVPMTISLLQDTGIGRVVNALKKQDGIIGDKAKAVVSAWKQMVSDSASAAEKPYEEESAMHSVKNKYSNSHSSKRKTPAEDNDSSDETPSKKIKSSSSQKDSISHSSKTSLSSSGSKYLSNVVSYDSDEYDPSNSSMKNPSSNNKYFIEIESHDKRHSSSPSSSIVYNSTSKHPGKNHTSRSHESLPDSKNESSKHKKNSNSSSKSQKQNSSSNSKSQHSSEKKPSSSKKKLIKNANSEEFNSTMASFEDILGLTDDVRAVKKKTVVKKTSTPNVKSQSKGHVKSSGSNVKSNSSSKRAPKKREDEMMELVRKTDIAPLDKNEVLSTLPEIQPFYKPLPHRFLEDSPNKKKKSALSNEDAILFTSSRNEKTAVYSGRKLNYLTEVPTLFEACVRVLMDNIEALTVTGGVPYYILKPVLEKCSPTQLYTLEDYNPYLLEDTDELWLIHCRRDFKRYEPDSGETWRELYLKKFDEREERLKALTATISASMATAKPVRQTKLAYVETVAKPPREVARKQAMYGTGSTSQPSKLAAAAAAHREKGLRVGALAMSSGAASVPLKPAPVPTPVPPKKPKVAPLMQKTLKFMKQRFKR